MDKMSVVTPASLVLYSRPSISWSGQGGPTCPVLRDASGSLDRTRFWILGTDLTWGGGGWGWGVRVLS